MLKITTIEAAELIKLIANQARRQLANRQLLRTVKADAHYRLNRDLDGADDNGEVYAFVKMLDEARTKADVDRIALDAEIDATAYCNDFSAKRRADYTVKRAAENGLVITREEVMATETARATQHYSVNAAIAELRKAQTVKVEKGAPAPEKFFYVVSNKPLCFNYDAAPLKSYIDKRVYVNETEKGFRLGLDASNAKEKNAFFSFEKYKFFDTEIEAVEYLADKANRMAADLDARKLTMTRLLCDAHNLLRELKRV